MKTSVVLDDSDFHFFKNMIEDRAGLQLHGAKKDLMQSRLRSRLVELGLTSFSHYRDFLSRLPNQHPEWQYFINSLTTNKTDFFREPQHFDFIIEKFLPEWLEQENKTLRIWSCASSTGEEPYSLSMTLHAAVPKNRDFRILATDVDTTVLEKASKGVYPSSLALQIPKEYHSKALAIGTGDISHWMRVQPHIKERITFKKHNLLDNEIPQVSFDLIFCRNVLIYFSAETASKIIKKLYRTAKQGSYLFIGHSESLQNIEHAWHYVRPSIYQKR